MENSIFDYIKEISNFCTGDIEKDFEKLEKWDRVAELAKMLKTSPKEAIVFSTAYFLTITEDEFTAKELRENVNSDPFSLGDIIETLESLHSKNLLDSGSISSNKVYKVSIELILEISAGKVPKVIAKNKKKDFFEICDELIDLFLYKMENMISPRDFDWEMQRYETTYKDFAPYTYLSKKKIPKREWPIFIFTLLSHIHGEADASLKKGIKALYYGIQEQFKIKTMFNNNTAALTKKGILEFTGAEFKSKDTVKISDKAMKEMLGKNYDIIISNMEKETISSDLIDPVKIAELNLFYNEKENKQLADISKILEPNRLHSIQQNLLKDGLKTGVCILLHGAPGTGKTESVLQIAKKSGRAIMKVDIASIRDKYIGESEKNLSEIFKKYERIRKKSKLTPILLFNEADALLNKRVTVRHSSDQMNNAMQNILLEELENFKGILFATTNLASNLDAAFERRFLYKVEFSNPDSTVRKSIWLQRLPELKDENIDSIIENYKLSGGQIENIVRKVKLDKIINGGDIEVDKLIELCKNESLNSSKDNFNQIGFKRA